MNFFSQLPPFGKGRSPLLSKNVNPLVKVLNAILRLRVLRNAGATTDEVLWSTEGLAIVIAGNASAGGGSTTGRLQTYKIKSKGSDAMIGRTWDAATSTEGSNNVWIAVNHQSRQLSSETINATTYTYSAYTDIGDGFNYTRTSDDGSTEETQIVTPMWYEDCIITAAAVNSSGVLDDSDNDIKLIEVSSRCWAKIEV